MGRITVAAISLGQLEGNGWRNVKTIFLYPQEKRVHCVKSEERGGRVMVLPVSTSVESFFLNCNAKMWKSPVLLIYHYFRTLISQNQHEDFLQNVWTQFFRKNKNTKKKGQNIFMQHKIRRNLGSLV